MRDRLLGVLLAASLTALVVAVLGRRRPRPPSAAGAWEPAPRPPGL